MKTIAIINLIVNAIIVGYFIYKYFPFSLSFERTFWMKRLYGIILWVKTSEHSKKGIFVLRIRNYEKADNWDQAQLKNGEYSKYKAKLVTKSRNARKP